MHWFLILHLARLALEWLTIDICSQAPWSTQPSTKHADFSKREGRISLRCQVFKAPEAPSSRCQGRKMWSRSIVSSPSWVRGGARLTTFWSILSFKESICWQEMHYFWWFYKSFMILRGMTGIYLESGGFLPKAGRLACMFYSPWDGKMSISLQAE